MQRLQQLLEEFQAAKAVWDEVSPALGKVKELARGFYERYRRDERHIYSDADMQTLFPFLIESLWDKPEPQSSAKAIWQEISLQRQQSQAAGQRLQLATQALEQETAAHAQRFAQLLSTRAAALRERITDLLAPYCSNRQQALSLARQCDGAESPMGLELRASAWTIRSGDLEARAQKILSALSAESAPAEPAPAPAGA